MTVLDRVDAITAEARSVDLGRMLLTAIAAVLFALGWLAAKVFTMLARLLAGAVTALRWSVAAVRVGWREGRPNPARP